MCNLTTNSWNFVWSPISYLSSITTTNRSFVKQFANFAWGWQAVEGWNPAVSHCWQFNFTMTMKNCCCVMPAWRSLCELDGVWRPALGVRRQLLAVQDSRRLPGILCQLPALYCHRLRLFRHSLLGSHWSFKSSAWFDVPKSRRLTVHHSTRLSKEAK